MISPPGEPDAALRVFLAEHEPVCPGCRQGLRGISVANCPECGIDLRLELKDPRRPWAGTAFLLLLLGWILAASTMNLSRNVRAAAAAYRDSVSGPGPAMVARIDAEIDQLKRNRTMYSGAYDTTYDRWIDIAEQRRARAQARYPAYHSIVDVVRQWPLQDQVGAIWAGALCLASLTGLICFAALRIAAPNRRLTVLKAWALVTFAVYAGWHIVRFTIEASAW